MNKAEYVKRREELQAQLTELRAKYIASNSPLKTGTKVKVVSTYYDKTTKEERGVLLGYTCKYNEVEPIVAKMNKDGSAHATARIYVGSSKLVPIE